SAARRGADNRVVCVVRWPIVVCLAIVFGCVALPATVATAAPDDAPRHPFWGRFAPGAWRISRAELSTFGPQGELSSSSVTETRTTFESRDGSVVTLDVREVVEIAGKRLEADPRRVVEPADDVASADGVDVGDDSLE